MTCLRRYFILRTDGRYYMGARATGRPWLKNSNGRHAIWEDAEDARRVAAELGAQGHECSVEAEDIG